MKILVLYFMFFVFTAILLVQCAKLFPTKDKLQLKHLNTTKKSAAYNANTMALNCNDTTDVSIVLKTSFKFKESV